MLLWENCGIGLKDRLQKYQNRAARVITRSTHDIRWSDLLEKLNWKSPEKRRKYLKFIFIYKILNGHTAPKLKDAFCPINERDLSNLYNLRNRETDLAPPMPKKEFGKRCFSYNGALHWHNIPNEAKIVESLRSFKSILRWLPTVIMFQFTYCLKVYYFFFVKVVVLKPSHHITMLLNIFNDENFRWFISSPWQYGVMNMSYFL